MEKTIRVQPTQYRLVEFLGEGLNSCVYRAIKEEKSCDIQFEVALKILKSERMVELWRNEFERLAAVRSERCVRLLGWEWVNKSPALILEYVRGVTLCEFMASESLTSDEIIEIITQTLSGITALSEGGLFHGDLNLHNIMLDEAGDVKLVDFGVQGKGGAFMVTPRYAAPEVLGGGRPCLSTDIYSLRAIAVEVCQKNNCPVINDVETLRSRVAHYDSAEVRRNLSQKVKALRGQKQLQMGSTRKVVFNKKRSALSMRAARFGIFAGLVFLSTFSQGDQRMSARPREATISVRSQGWLRFFVNGKEKGYAPLEIPVKTGERLRIRWTSRSGHGQSSLTLEVGQHIVLDDEFFRRHTSRHHSGPD